MFIYVQRVKLDGAFKISILDLKQVISAIRLWQELLLGAEEPDRMAQTNAISIWYYCSHPSPLLTWIISRMSVSGLSPPYTNQTIQHLYQNICSTIMPFAFISNPVWSSLSQYGWKRLYSVGMWFIFLLCYPTSGTKPQRGNFCLWALLNSGKAIPQAFNEKDAVGLRVCTGGFLFHHKVKHESIIEKW